MKKEICKLIVAFSVIAISLLIIDKAVGVIGRYAMLHMDNRTSDIGKANYLLNKVDDVDVLIIGSSRASHHYIPQMLQEYIKANYAVDSVSVYNAGIDGHFATFNMCAAKSVLQRYIPKMLVLEIMPTELCVFDGSGRSVSQLAPFCNVSNIAAAHVKNKDMKTRVQLASNMYCLNGKLLPVVKEYVFGSKTDGYEPLYSTMQDASLERNVEQLAINEKVVSEFGDFLEFVAGSGCNVVIATSPYFRFDSDCGLLSDMCDNYGVSYIDMMNVEYFDNHPELFKDISHLNDDGAKQYTQMFFDVIHQRGLINWADAKK